MTKAKQAETANTADAPSGSNESAAPAADTEKDIPTSDDVQRALGETDTPNAPITLSEKQFAQLMEQITVTVREPLDALDKRINRIERQLGIGTGSHE